MKLDRTRNLVRAAHAFLRVAQRHRSIDLSDTLGTRRVREDRAEDALVKALRPFTAVRPRTRKS